MTDIDTLLIARPKKDGGSFICNIKQPFVIDLPNSQLVHIKETNEAAQFIFIKNKPIYNYIFDLNTKIIEIVKENCSIWFNTNMNPDLVEDYYTSTLVYDKSHGELIKLKVVAKDDSTLISSELIGNKLNIRLKVSNLRFYKQKFVLETMIETYESTCDIIDFSDEEEVGSIDDLEPYPSIEEIKEMRDKMIVKCQTEISEIELKVAELLAKKEVVVTKKTDIELTSNVDDVIRLYNEFSC